MNRPLLLDTCAALWVMNNTPMRKAAVEAIAGSMPRGEIHVSPVTAWEVGMLASKGRFKSNYAPQRWLQLLLSQSGIKMAGMTPEMLMESSFLPGDIQGDPGDRIIAATAREYGMTVITRDRALLDYARAGHLSAVEC